MHVACTASWYVVVRRHVRQENLWSSKHKRPCPKSMRPSHSEGRTQAAPRQEVVDVLGGSPRYMQHTTQLSGAVGTAQCYNSHTIVMLLWRKGDKGKTV